MSSGGKTQTEKKKFPFKNIEASCDFIYAAIDFKLSLNI